MAKIKELLAEREKLAKYDELVEWKKKFENEDMRMVDSPRGGSLLYALPAHIKQILVSALDAEIKKLEKE